MPEDRIYWLDEFEGKAKGGFFYRSEIAKDLKKVTEEHGFNVVGIKVSTDGDWTVEFIIEDTDNKILLSPDITSSITDEEDNSFKKVVSMFDHSLCDKWWKDK